MGAITLLPPKTIDDVRTEILDIIDDHLSEIETMPSVVYGDPFYFMESQIIEVPLNVKVKDLAGFMKALENIHASAVYNHIFEARFRVKKGKSDFAIWFDEVLGLHQLAGKIENLDCYMYSLEGLRERIISLCKEEIK